MNLTDRINEFKTKYNLPDDAIDELKQLTLDCIIIGKKGTPRSVGTIK